jgi:hypothetical protein
VAAVGGGPPDRLPIPPDESTLLDCTGTTAFEFGTGTNPIQQATLTDPQMKSSLNDVHIEIVPLRADVVKQLPRYFSTATAECTLQCVVG